MSIQSFNPTTPQNITPAKIEPQINAGDASSAGAAPEKTAKSPLAGRVVKQIAHFSFQAAKLTGQGLFKLGQGVAFVATKFAQLVKSLHDKYKAYSASTEAKPAPRALQQRKATLPKREQLDVPHASVGKKLHALAAQPSKRSVVRDAPAAPSRLASVDHGLNLTGFRNTNPDDLKFIAAVEKRKAALSLPDDPAKAAEHQRLANLSDQAWLEQMEKRLNAVKKND